MNSSPCLWVFLLTITSATIGKIAGRSPIRTTSGAQCIPGVPIPTRYPCSDVCDCSDDGQMDCYSIECPCMFMDCRCPGLYVPEGECCARCPEQDCSAVRCREPSCDIMEQLTEPGACCPRCYDDDYENYEIVFRSTTGPPAPRCVPGETFKPDQCTTCTCENDGSMSCVGTPLSIPTGCPKAMMTTDECGVQHCPDCSTVLCAAPPCPEAKQLTLPGECCRICDAPQSECELGTKRKLAGDPCTRCKCKAGDNGITQEVCKTKTCPELSCTETYTQKRNCCPQCAPVCSGVVCPQLVCPQRFQKQKKSACCPRCTRCEGVVCESLDCPEEFQKTKRGECCPTCNRKWLRIQNILG